MTRKLLIVCLLTAIFPLLSGTVSAQFLSWDYINILDDVREGGNKPAMIKAPDGTLHITFWNTEEDRLRYARKAPGSNVIQFEYIDTITANGALSAIALDAQGNPHIAYYENNFGVSRLRYAYRTAPGNWVIESVPSQNGLGYGRYDNYEYKPTLNLQLTNGSDPQIIAFNGHEGPTNNCIVQDNELRSYHCYKSPNGTWRTKRLGWITGIDKACNADTMPFGDRYGEYSTSFIDAQGRHNVVLMAYTLGKTYHFVADQTDTVWTQQVIDSLQNQHSPELVNYDGCGGFSGCWDWITLYLTPEGFSSTVTPNGNIHLGYTTSLVHGGNFFAAGKRFNLVLHTMIDSLGNAYYHDFDSVHSQDQHYRSHTDLTYKGNDTLFMSYVDRDAGEILLSTSYDQGVNWTHDTIVATSIATQSPVELVGDTLNVLIYLREKDRLVLARKNVNFPNDPWDFLEITNSQNRAVSMDAKIVRGSSDSAFVAYNDAFNEQLLFATGYGSGANWTWTHEQLDQSGSDFGAISYARADDGTDYVMYAGGPDQDLRLATHTGGQWQYEIVDSANKTSHTDLVISDNDTLHAVWFGASTLCLNYAKRHIADSVWIRETVDCSNSPVGEYPELLVDENELPYVTYYDVADFTLKYATKNPQSRSWSIEYVDSFGISMSGQHNALEFGPNGLPVVVYVDAGNSNLKMAERTSGGTWDISVLETGGTTSLGRPTDLEFDQFGNPWVAYNYFASFDRVRLLHRDTIWRQVGVNSEGRIAGAFDLEVVDGDLFIIGKKTETNNSGLAMLYAQNGVFVDREEELETPLAELKAYPNPFDDELKFHLTHPTVGKVSIRLYNLYGQLVNTILEADELPAGEYDYRLNTSKLNPGIYFYELITSEGRLTHKLIRLQ